jgi:putative ABC transport system substrate-binding protein
VSKAKAARTATRTIPIVFTGVGDPVGAGVVPSLARPGGNATGVSLLATELTGKRLELLREIVPGVARVAMLWNDTNPGMVLRAQETRDAAPRLGVIVQSVGVHDLIDFETAFVGIESWQADALLTLVDPFTREHRKRIVDFAAQHRLPAIYEAREFVEAGGLVSYGPSLLATQRRAAEYIDKIFKGAKPADLPVEQPAVAELPLILRVLRRRPWAGVAVVAAAWARRPHPVAAAAACSPGSRRPSVARLAPSASAPCACRREERSSPLPDIRPRGADSARLEIRSLT